MHKLSPPLKYFGGKHYLAKKIIDLMPRHITYVEPYFGGGAVLLEKNPDGIGEVVNDLNGELTNFWRVLQDEDLFFEFSRQVFALPFSEAEYNKAQAESLEKKYDPGDLLMEYPCAEAAVNFFIRCRQSRAGQFKSFATVTRNRSRRGMNEQVSSWLTAVEGLPAVHERLKRVLILNRDALDVIRQMDGPGTLFYVDAPYVHETRATTDSYAHEMTDEQHEELIKTLSLIKGKAMVSMYHHPIYDVLHSKYGWRLVEFDLPNNAAGGRSKRRMTECLWMNYQ